MARILIAEDLPETALLLEEDLLERGHSIVTCSSVQKAIEELREDRKKDPDTQFEVAILDLRFDNFPDISRVADAGMDILDEAVQAPFLESIILTAYGTLPTAIRAVELGAL